MSTVEDKDYLTLDDLEVLILLNEDISEETRWQYLRLVDMLRAQVMLIERLTQG